MSKKLELDFQKDVIKYLTRNKIYHIRYTASTTFGVPDIICVLNGYFVGIELKREDGKGRASGLQDLTIKTIRESGGIAGLVSSIEELEELLYIAKTERLPTKNN